MDYSLLFAVEPNPNYKKGASHTDYVEFNKTRHTWLSKNGKFIYHLSIIDYLQAFNTEKKAESWVKTTVLGRD